MAFTLNFTAPLKQDPESRQRLRNFVEAFAEQIQPAIDTALARSELVHFARILVIDDKYIQVLTEFDGDPMQYTEYFRKELGLVFEWIFSLVEDAPPWEELNNPNAFFEFTHGYNLKSLGVSAGANAEQGYMFCACGDATVREIKEKLGQSVCSGV